MILNVFVCNMLLQNACKNHQTYVRKPDEHGPKIVPKPLQNRSWRGSGDLLGATLEARCFQDLIFDPKITKSMSEKMTKMISTWSQNLSKIDPGGGLEATWEPPLKQGASKTSFYIILAPFWDPLWDQFGLMLGTMFSMFF